MSEDPFSFGMKGFAEFWTQAGKAAQQAQQNATQSLAEAMKAWGVPTLTDASPKIDTAGLSQASEALAQLWKSAGELSANMAQSMIAATGKVGSGAKLEPTVEATFRTMADPRNWVAATGGMDSVMGAIAQGPQLADLWNAERQQAKIMQAWTEMRRRLLEHNAVVMQGWFQAARAFGEEIAGCARADGRPLDHNAVLALWTETANRVLLDMQRSDAFLQTQAAMIRSGAEFKLAQREMAERWAEQFGLPSRTELDDVHRSLTELKREFRAYKRKQAEPRLIPANKTRQGA